jgi:hypothetical protein
MVHDISVDNVFKWVSAGAMMSATSLKSHGKIESGPAALCILSSESSLWTPLHDMLMSGIVLFLVVAS